MSSTATLARDLRTGDRLAEDGVLGLEHHYHTAERGTDVTVTAVRVTNYGDDLEVTLSDGRVLDTRPDLQVTVTR
jgi:hypothetical protein